MKSLATVETRALAQSWTVSARGFALAGSEPGPVARGNFCGLTPIVYPESRRAKAHRTSPPVWRGREPGSEGMQ
jgi:hypothetical protein